MNNKILVLFERSGAVSVPFRNYKSYGKFISKIRYGNFKRSYTPMEVGEAMVNQWSYLFKNKGETLYV